MKKAPLPPSTLFFLVTIVIGCLTADAEIFFDRTGIGWRRKQQPVFTETRDNPAPGSATPATIPGSAPAFNHDLPGYTGSRQPGALWTNSMGMVFAYIPAGQFLMGTNMPGPAFMSETPERLTTLTRPFLIQTKEVTRQQFKALMDPNAEAKKSDILPKDFVSCIDIYALCEKLGQREGRFYRLPTEAEWEFASRAGTHTRFIWGDEWQDGRANVANTGGQSENMESHRAALQARGVPERSACPVGLFPPNAWGIYDMDGNLGEYCMDWYKEWTSAPVTDPAGPQMHAGNKVVRGGAWNGHARNAEITSRTNWRPNQGYEGIGFRLVITSFEPQPADGRSYSYWK